MRRGLVIVILLFTLACASRVASPTGEISEAYALLEDAKVQGGETYAPHIMKDARSFYERAEKEFREGNRERAEEFQLISEIRAKTAISISKRKLYENEIERLQSEIIEASSIKKTNEDELRKNSSKLEQIRDRISISQERMRSNALDALEKAGEKIKAAEDVSAGDFDPQTLRDAREANKEAQESLNAGEYERATELAEKTAAIAERAYESSKKKSDLRDEILQRVSQIYGAKAEPVKEGIRVTLDGVFAPSGNTVLFDAYPSLDALGSVLTKYPNLRVTIEAYTNDMKSEKENLKLSQAQAEAVRGYLVSKGLLPERFKAEGLGVPKSQERDKIKNRRIEFTLELFESSNI
ncbi:MAG: OmpA family protein [Ignavibacteriales bacterium]